MTDYAEVLNRRHQGRVWTLIDNDYERLTILDDGDKPSKKSLDDAWPEVQNQIAVEREQRVQARQSALAKLSELGLSAAEIAALVG